MAQQVMFCAHNLPKTGVLSDQYWLPPSQLDGNSCGAGWREQASFPILAGMGGGTPTNPGILRKKELNPKKNPEIDVSFYRRPPPPHFKAAWGEGKDDGEALGLAGDEGVGGPEPIGEQRLGDLGRRLGGSGGERESMGRAGGRGGRGKSGHPPADEDPFDA